MIFSPIFLYAETHYRFKYFFSLLKKSEPEILADAPHRLDPDTDLPVLILIKDAHHYPIRVQKIIITLYQDQKQFHQQTFALDESISEHFWSKILSVKFAEHRSSVFGFITADIEITITSNGKTKTIKNDNHRTSSKQPLEIYRSKTHLPSLPGWIYGDAHTHSSYTEDQVEFGSPISAGPTLCKAMGISFFCVTDHSYDLDDRIDNYLVNDPEIPKWKLFQDEVTTINQTENDFTVVRGEEVSCTNADSQNVHLLLFGTRKYFHGSGDSAEKWFHTKCESSVSDVLSRKEGSVAAYAGHPTEHVPFIQQLLINRGEWTKKDMAHDGLQGIQILNGEHSEHFFNGLDVWKWLLLGGKKKFIAGGNDAHGNYNRFIQIGIPFISIREKSSQIFGKMKTAVYSSHSEDGIISALHKGTTIITNGPLLIIEVETDFQQTGKIGERVKGKKFLVKVRGKSTEEFGRFKTIKIFHGIIGKKEKEMMEVKHFQNFFAIHFITDWETAPNFSYIRAEAITQDAHGVDRNGFCYTNPIWILSE